MSETIFNLSNVITYYHSFVIIIDDNFPLIRGYFVIRCPVLLDGLVLLANSESFPDGYVLCVLLTWVCFLCYR